MTRTLPWSPAMPGPFQWLPGRLPESEAPVPLVGTFLPIPASVRRPRRRRRLVPRRSVYDSRGLLIVETSP
jgi:hypothetical protein